MRLGRLGAAKAAWEPCSDLLAAELGTRLRLQSPALAGTGWRAGGGSGAAAVEPVVRPAWTGRDRQPAAIHPLVSTSPGNGNEHELQPAGDARFYGVSLALAKRRWTGPVEVSCLSSPSVRGLSLRARRAPSRVTMGALRRSWSSRAKRRRSKLRRGRSSRRATGRLAWPRTGHASRKLASSQVCGPLPLIIRPPPPADRPFRPTLTQ